MQILVLNVFRIMTVFCPDISEQSYASFFGVECGCKIFMQDTIPV